MRLQNKVAIVTGASLGIGSAIAKRFGREGAKVAVNYLKSEDSANNVVRDIASAGGTAKSFKADISKVPEIEKLTKEVLGEWDNVDILVNNAGVFRTVPVMETTEDNWDCLL